MGIFTNFDTGGQVSMHRLRMRFQNLKTTFKITFLLSLTFFLWRSYQDIETYAWRLLYEKYRAEAVMMVPLLDKTQIYQAHLHTNDRYYNTRPADILRDPWVQRAGPYITDQLLSKALQSLLVFVSLFSVIMGIFIYRGRKRLEKKENRGARIEKPEILAKMLKKRKKASDLNLDGIPLLKDAETQHIMLTGTTGAGKTNCIHTLLPQIRDRGDKAIIIDVTGDYVQRYYRKGIDIILNPFDARGASWNLWEELTSGTDYDLFAKACISSSTHHDEFWTKAASKILSTALDILSKEQSPTVGKLYNTLVKYDLKKYETFFKGTDATPYVDVKGEKTTLSIRTTLSANIDFLKHLKSDAGRAFIFREWLQDESDEKPWVFISCNSTNIASLKPLMTAWLDLAVHLVMSLEPSFDRRV